eukprot:XP_001694830.1 predicted protein [Chlamydomonas reinhardtii]
MGDEAPAALAPTRCGDVLQTMREQTHQQLQLSRDLEAHLQDMLGASKQLSRDIFGALERLESPQKRCAWALTAMQEQQRSPKLLRLTQRAASLPAETTTAGVGRAAPSTHDCGLVSETAASGAVNSSRRRSQPLACIHSGGSARQLPAAAAGAAPTTAAANITVLAPVVAAAAGSVEEEAGSTAAAAAAAGPVFVPVAAAAAAAAAPARSGLEEAGEQHLALLDFSSTSGSAGFWNLAFGDDEEWLLA